MVKVLDQVIFNMTSMPPASELDINNITLRLALDITGSQQLHIPIMSPLLQERAAQAVHCLTDACHLPLSMSCVMGARMAAACSL